MRTKAATQSHPALPDVQELRRRARRLMDQGAVGNGSAADRTTLIRVLNGVLATWLVCILRHKRHCHMASGIHPALLQNANRKQSRSGPAVKGMLRFPGLPDFDAARLTSRSPSSYAEGKSLLGMIREDLVAERIAVESYSEIIRYLGDKDPTTRTMMDKIMGTGEQHAEEITVRLESLVPNQGLAA